MSALSEISQDPALYVVATPIGNLEDLSNRAIQILRSADLIAAEDTRHSRGLLQQVGAGARLISAHAHNERRSAGAIIDALTGGQTCALISDAGTPAISDPGARVVHAVRQAGFRVIPVPGASAPVTLLSAAGIDPDQFGSTAGRWVFAGFLPTRSAARIDDLSTLKALSLTVVLLESPKRMPALAEAICTVFGLERTVVIGRELTKRFEEIACLPSGELAQWLVADENRQRGEYVLAIAPPARAESPGPESVNVTRDTPVNIDITAGALLDLLGHHLPAAKAARVAARLTALPRDALYQLLISETRKTD